MPPLQSAPDSSRILRRTFVAGAVENTSHLLLVPNPMSKRGCRESAKSRTA